jgi:hypothetical protein
VDSVANSGPGFAELALLKPEEEIVMKKPTFVLVTLILEISSLASFGQEVKYPPLSAYMMPRDAEISLAKSAAPASISDRATIKVLTNDGFEVAHQGDNGFVCMVMRGFTGAPTFTPVQFRLMSYDPKTLAPICLNLRAVKTVLPYYELRTKLAIQGKSPEQIAEAVQDAYEKGEIPKRAEVSFGYMWSADQVLGPAGHWHPHIMVYAPNYDNSMLGGNEVGGHLPSLSDDAGTPFSVVVIPVDEKLAIHARK